MNNGLLKVINEHKQKLAGSHFILSAENPAAKPELKMTHEQVLHHLRSAGYDSHSVNGHYGAPERSIITYGINAEQAEHLHKLAGRLGQHSSLHSDGTNHELRFHQGKDKGKRLRGTGTDWHDRKPQDNYTALPGGVHHFSHRFGQEEDLEKGEANSAVQGVADAYAKGKGITLSHGQSTKVNPEFSTKVADAYHNMKHDPNHPDVKAAYGALIGETKDQFKHIQNSGLRISKIKPGQDNPYKTSKDLHNDIRNNNHMWYFPTESGFGTDDSSPHDHPMLQPTDVHHDGKPMLANDMFRVVHDYFGHAKEGHSFGPSGEESAYQDHSQMFSPLARKALTTETRGQNSWVNFGPHAAHNKANPAKTIFADQKAGLMPDWTMNDPHGKMHKSEDDGVHVFHGSNTHFEQFDTKHQKSGFYPGIYSTPDKARAAEHGKHLYEAKLKGKYFEFKNPNHAEELARHYGVAHSGSGHPLAQKLQENGYAGIKRGSEYITFHPKDIEMVSGPGMKKSELAKGSLQARTPFKPSKLDPKQKETVKNWQTSAGDLEERPKFREQIQPMDQNARTRALHKLTGKTQVRKTPEGKREFLLHRGMSPKELEATVHPEGKSVNHDHHSSWTPNKVQANKFAYHHNNPGKTVSSWIHEDNVHFIPNQYGAVDDEYATVSSRKNRYRDEQEVIVKPHHNSSVVGMAPYVQGAESSIRPGHMSETPENVDDAINTRQRKLDRDKKFMAQLSPELRERYADTPEEKARRLKQQIVDRRGLGKSEAHFTYLIKSADDDAYKKFAHSGMALMYPVSIQGKTHNPHNGVGYHNTIKVFDRDRDSADQAHEIAKKTPMRPPNPKHVGIKPITLTGQGGYTVYALELTGPHTHEMKHNNSRFQHMGYQTPYEFKPHISVDKETWENIRDSGHDNAEAAGIRFGHPELRQGERTLARYQHRNQAETTGAMRELRFAGMGKSEEVLEKGMMRNLAAGAAAAGAIASASCALAPNDHDPKAGSHQIEQTNHVDGYDHHKMLRAIASVESSDGKNLNHKPTSQGVAYGKWALMPNTIRDTIHLNKDLAQHKRALDLDNSGLAHYISENPGLEQQLAEHHLNRLESHFGQNRDAIGFAWNQGVSGTHKALKTNKDIQNHPYVEKIREAYRNAGI